MAIYKANRPNREPTHPGELLPDILADNEISVTQFVKDVQISRAMYYKLIKKAAGITADMALKLGRYLGNGPAVWLNMQQAYDLWHAERTMTNVLEKIPESISTKGRLIPIHRSKQPVRGTTKKKYA